MSCFRDAFARADRLAHQGAIGRDDRGKATARNRSNAPAGVLGDLCLLIGIQPGCRADHEARGFQSVLPDVDLSLFRKQVAEIEPGYIAEWISSPSAIIA